MRGAHGARDGARGARGDGERRCAPGRACGRDHGREKDADLIPLCHPLPLTSVSVDFEFIDGGVRVTTKARVVGQTGVEMEALTAAAVAGLTLIDMTKGVERGVYLETVRLLEKSGGRSGTWKR